jgi:signal transduction histidine kinase
VHDRIGQNLALSKIRVGELRSRPGQAGQPTAGALDEVMALLDEAILDARELTFELCPPMLYELGLAPALEWLAERTRESHGLAVEFHEDDQPKPLDEDVQALLFRGAQELLVNVVKHARADRARVELRREGDQVILTVTDDGVGMDPAKAVGVPADDGGFGLFSLRERLGYIGGRMEIASSGAGSRVTLVAPLARRPGPSAAAGQTSGDSA